MSRVLLVVPPFHARNLPAVGVSLLKAALVRDGVPCDVLYLNLQFAAFAGPEFYKDLGEEGPAYKSLIGEWLFAEDLFGEQTPPAEPYIEEILLGRFKNWYDRTFVERLLQLRARVPAFLDQAMDAVDWGQYAIIGVTSTFQQNCPGLTLLRRVKARFPQVKTIMGGSNCEGEMGVALHELFPWVDFVCNGEGERVFPLLVKGLLAGQPVSGVPGILARGGLTVLGGEFRAPTIRDMDRLPFADYDDFFEQFAASPVSTVVRPMLAFETSRGCWWGEKHHCTFCGFNGQGMEYRSKSPDRALEELDYLIERHGIRDVELVDNILDMRYFSTFLTELAARTMPPSMFYETKANLTREQLQLLARAGVRQIQPGIESLSTPTLKLMEKGVTLLQNVRLLKWCAEIGISAAWSILYGFPREDPTEYERMADLVPLLTHLEPPLAVPQLRLDRFSPHFYRPEEYGFVNLRPDAPYFHVYPVSSEEVHRLAYHFEYDYADGRDPETYTLRLRQQVAEWSALYGQVRLELHDNGDQLEIVDSRPAAIQPHTVLDGPQRLTYLALDGGTTARAVQTELARVLGEAAPPVELIEGWLADWETARLVLREGDRVLSLAVNPHGRVWLPAERFAALLSHAGA